MAKSAPSPPPAPDPNVVSGAQTTSNIDTAIAQGIMNHQDQTTPYGSLTFTKGADQTVDGRQVPTWSSNVTLTPAQQQALESQQSLTQSLYGLGNQETGRVSDAVSKPFDISGITKIPTDPQALDQQGIDAAYKQATSRLDPQWDQAQRQEEAKLAQEGITPGNAAFDTEMANFQRGKTDAYQTAGNNAVSQGAAIAGQKFGQDVAANQNQLQEANFLREQPLNEAIALMSGQQIGNPNFTPSPQTGLAPTDVTGAYGLQQSAQNAAYQGQVGAASSGNAAGAGLLGAGITAAAIFF